jgi:hypothetical protein
MRSSVTKADLLKLLETIDVSGKIVLYDGDDTVFKLSYFGEPEDNELWLKVEFSTTVEDLDG